MTTQCALAKRGPGGRQYAKAQEMLKFCIDGKSVWRITQWRLNRARKTSVRMSSKVNQKLESTGQQGLFPSRENIVQLKAEMN